MSDPTEAEKVNAALADMHAATGIRPPRPADDPTQPDGHDDPAVAAALATMRAATGH
jgi:hypothetical protein